MKTSVVNSKLFGVKFATDVQPKVSVDISKGILKYGKNNKQPEQLLFWYHNSAQHGAIVKGKARYVAGLSITSQTAQEWLEKANPFENWHSLVSKLTLDDSIFGGYFIQIVSNIFGQPVQFFHLDFAKCRVSDCLNYVVYCEDWTKSYEVGIQTFPIWHPNTLGTSVYYQKGYTPTTTKIQAAYPTPEYMPCALDIDTDCRLATYFNSLVQKNFNPSAIVTIFSGETDQTKRQKIVDKLKGDYAGEDNAGEVVTIFTTKDGKATEVTTLAGNDLDKQYQELQKRCQQNILSGHNVSGVLFKVKTEGQLGNRTELVEAHELFANEYVSIKQEPYLEMLEMFYNLKTGLTAEFEFEQVRPIGLELPLDNQNVIGVLSKDELRAYINDKFKLNLANTAVGVASVNQINDNLKGLSAAENADMLRIVRDYQSQRKGMTKELAISRIMSYGVSENEAKNYLQIQASKHEKENKFVTLFNKYAHDIDDGDEILEINLAEPQSTQFAKFDKTQNDVLELLKGNPSLTEKDLSKTLGLDEEAVLVAIAALVAGGLVASAKDFTPTEKGSNKKTAPIDSEVYTEWVYGLREDQAGRPLILSTTRDFCRQMVNLTRSKALSYDAIVQLNNEFGENAWYFRGGWYNNGEETTQWCRHAWKAVTKIRRKK
jgi:hypothetical protein